MFRLNKNLKSNTYIVSGTELQHQQHAAKAVIIMCGLLCCVALICQAAYNSLFKKIAIYIVAILHIT